MSAPDARRAPRPEGARSESVTAKRSDATKSMPALARLSWNGHPALLSTYWRRDLRNAGREPDALALAIFETLGAKRSRAVAYELLGLSQEVV